MTLGLGFCANWLTTPNSVTGSPSTLILFSVSKNFPSGTRFTALHPDISTVIKRNSDIFVRRECNRFLEL